MPEHLDTSTQGRIRVEVFSLLDILNGDYRVRDTDTFDRCVKNYAGNPLELRDLLMAAARCVNIREVFSSPTIAAGVQRITDRTHSTYASAANALMAHHFDNTGRYWLCFVRANTKSLPAKQKRRRCRDAPRLETDHMSLTSFRVISLDDQ